MNVFDTMGNVQTSKNIRLASGVNFTKINDELKRRANTLADILKNEYGMNLVISSGYRTKAQQAAILAKGTGYMTAQPGRSKHQYGKAFDVAINSHMKPQFYKSKKAMQQYGGNFNAFWADMTRRAGLYRFSPNGDPPHHTLPPGTQYGGSPGRMNNSQYATSYQSSGGSIWGAPEGAQARAIAYGKGKARQIKGWGVGPGKAQPHNFSSSPLFIQFVNRTVRETGVNPQHAATFLNFILNASAMGESKLGSAQIGFDPKDKGTFQIRDGTFAGLKRGNRTHTRGLDPSFSRKLAAARDVYDMTTEEQAILSLINAASAQGPFRAKMRKGAAAVASGNMNAIRDAMVDYIITLHWAGGSPGKALANMQAAINRAAAQGKKNIYGVATAQQYYNQKLVPMYRKQADSLLNYISRRR